MQNLNESYIGHKVRELKQDLGSHNYFGINKASAPITPTSGFDMGSRTAGATSYPTGVPLNPRHRQYFGMGLTPRTNL